MTILRVNTIAGIGSTHFGTTLSGNVKFNSQNYVVLPKGTSTQSGVLRDTADVVGTGGTFYDNLVLAMPFNAATGLRDVSSRNRNPGYGGTTNNVSISSTISKYYGSSVKFDGTGDFLQFTGIGSDFVFDNQFTIEFWIRLNSIVVPAGVNPSPISFIKSDGTNGGQVYLNATNNFFSLWNGSSDIVTTGNSSVTTDSWFHVAVTRDSSNNCRIFLDGTLKNTASSTFVFGNTPGSLRIGTFNVDAAANTIDGFMQDLRIYKGIAKYASSFTPPDRIAEVGVGFTAGQLRYNTDSNRVELYDGNQWTQVQMSQVGLGTGGDTGAGARGVFGGGIQTPVNVNIIEYINIVSTGNAIDFGDLVSARDSVSSLSSSTRGVFSGGGPSSNILEYITIASTGNTQDFGDMTISTGHHTSASNETRGLNAGGPESVSPLNTIDYITIASTGNAVDFGDLTQARWFAGGGRSNSTRAIFCAGWLSPATGYNIIDFVTIATLGNAQDFGDTTLSQYGSGQGNSSSPTRSIWAGGSSTGGTPGANNVIQYVQINTLGNAAEFGDLSRECRGTGSTGNSIRGIFAGGAPGYSNIIDYVIISQFGNAVDFGDLSGNRAFTPAGLSNAHGGL